MNCESYVTALQDSIQNDRTLPVSQYNRVNIVIMNSTVSDATITMDQQNQLVENLSKQTISDFTDPTVQRHMVSAIRTLDPTLGEQQVQQTVSDTIGIIFQFNSVTIVFDMAQITNLDLYIQQYNLQESVVSSIANQFCIPPPPPPPQPTPTPSPAPSVRYQWVFYLSFLILFFALLGFLFVYIR